MFRIQSLAVLACCTVLGDASAVGSPVERVVHLLQDLKAKIEHDGKQEEQVYNKYACWCEKTTDRKANAISDAQEELRALGQQILKLKGKIATLTAEIEELAAAIKKNEEDQAEATAIRNKENEAFTAATTEMKEVLAALEKAIIVLHKGTASLLQSGAHAAAVKHVVDLLPSTVSLKTEHLSLLAEFATGHASYAPQSMTVQGILRDMYDTFSNDLESATVTEATSNRDFENFIATKMKELLQDKATKVKKEDEKAEAETMLADTTQNYDDTESQMHADIKFFDETKKSCEAKHDEWTTREDLRKEELAGVEKAIEILSSDDARALFDKSIKAGKEVRAQDNYNTDMKIDSFLQTDSSSGAQSAYASLRAVAAETHSLRLASLAVQVRTAKVGHFDKVIKSIDDMIALLKEENDADIAKRDQCNKEYQDIASTSADLKWKIEKNVAKIDKLEGLIELRTEQRLKTIEDIKDTREQIAKMEDQRIEENQVFLAAKADDQGAIELLVKARKALKSYFEKNDIKLGPIQGGVKDLALNQEDPVFEISEDQAPEAEFTGKGHRKNESKGIVSLMTMLIEDLNDEIKNGMKNEEKAQLEFEEWLKSAKKLEEDLVAKKINLKEIIAKRTEEKDEEHEDKENNEKDLKEQEDYKAEITPDCDWILGAFKQRYERRTAEQNGLVSAKAFLAGKKASLVQKASSSFDDDALGNLHFSSLRR